MTRVCDDIGELRVSGRDNDRSCRKVQCSVLYWFGAYPCDGLPVHTQRKRMNIKPQCPVNYHSPTWRCGGLCV